MEYFDLYEKWIWFGFAAVGFAILFNVPKRTLFTIFLMAALGGTLKMLIMSWHDSVILGTFAGAVLVGFLSIWAAHSKHSPPFVFAIPSVIPMVPGAFAYRTMKGIIEITNNTDPDHFLTILNSTVSNGFKTMFILIAISLGVSTPMLLTRRDSVKEIRIKFKKPTKK
ncbi:threonine/serine exporter family protein [Zunongwangia sp.]|uniref:threonine/serine exporter family protein n=1 Tax=Zunongwangia sp. TaxID=1965325 RepID=UPI003AA7BDB7